MGHARYIVSRPRFRGQKMLIIEQLRKNSAEDLPGESQIKEVESLINLVKEKKEKVGEQ